MARQIKYCITVIFVSFQPTIIAYLGCFVGTVNMLKLNDYVASDLYTPLLKTKAYDTNKKSITLWKHLLHLIILILNTVFSTF